MRLKAFAPCRIDLAGGTLDIHPLFLMIPDACTVNLAIDIGVEVTVEALDTKRSEIEIIDKNLSFGIDVEGPHIIPAGGELVASIVTEFHKRESRAVRIKTRSFSPAGAGLAASSALCVALTSALLKLMGMTLSDPDFIRLCLDLEARVLATPTGYQDFIAAHTGGVQSIRYTPGEISSDHLRFNADDLAQHLTLVYTGRPHHSGLNNWEVYRGYIEGEKTVRSAMAEIAYIANQMAGAINSGDWPAVAQLLDKEWRQRKRLSPVVSTQTIDELVAAVAQTGSYGKVCGSGGGGCVILCHDGAEETKAGISKIIGEHGLSELSWKPDMHGCRVEEF